MFSINALFNVVPWWEESWKMGVGSAAMVLLMAAIPICLEHFRLRIVWKVLGFLLGIALCYMLWEGTAEQISMARDSVATGAKNKIDAFNDYKDKIGKKKVEKDGYIQKLNWRIGSQDAVNAAKTAFANASSHKETVCKAAPFGPTCQKATTEADNAQTKLADATNDLDWATKVHDLEIEIPQLEAQQKALNAPTEDPQARAAARTATYLQKFGFKLTADDVKDRRPMDMAAVGEGMSFIGPIIMLNLIHGFFSMLRSFAHRIEPLSVGHTVELQLPAIHLSKVAVKPAQPAHEPEKLAHDPVQNQLTFDPEPEQTGTETGSLRPARRESVRQWKELRVTDRKGGKTLKSTARADYEAFCRARGEEPVNPTLFGNEIKKLGAEKAQNDRRYYYGIVLKPPLKLVKSI
jgi:hypothetical protein